MALQLQEKLYLLHLGVEAYNKQYNLNYVPEQFDVVQIPSNRNSKFGFEFSTLLNNDYVRFRLYCTLGDIDSVGQFILFDELNKGTGPGDEIYVADAMLSNEFLYSGNNQIRQSFVAASTSTPDESIYLQSEDGDVILTEAGEPIEL